MRRLFLSSALLAVTCVCAGGNFGGQKFLGLNGKVESIKETTYDAVENSGRTVPGEMRDMKMVYFDKDGHMVKQGYYFTSGDCASLTEYRYENDKLVLIEEKADVDELLCTRKLVGVKDGKEVWEIRHEDSDKVMRETLTRDKAKGYVCTDPEKQDQFNARTEYWYDGAGNLIRMKLSGLEPSDFLYEFEYNKNNEMLKSVLTSGEESHVITYKYTKHDDKGNWTECIQTPQDDSSSVLVREIKYVN